MIHAIFPDLRKMILEECPQLDIQMGRLVEVDEDAIIIEEDFEGGDVGDRICLIVQEGKLVVRGEDPQHRRESVTWRTFDLADPDVFKQVVSYVQNWGDGGGEVGCDGGWIV